MERQKGLWQINGGILQRKNKKAAGLSAEPLD